MDSATQYYAHLLQSCNTQNSIRQGKQIHLLFLKKGILTSALTIGNRLLQMYSRCGHMSDAVNLFDEMPERNSFSWNTMIEGYMKSGNKEKSLQVFDTMPLKNDFSWNMIITGFVKAGELNVAHKLLYEMPRKDVVSWNSVIHGYARNGYPLEALRLFKELKLSSDAFILATVVRACTDLRDIRCGKQIHARIVIENVGFDSVLCSSLINLYGKCGDMGSGNSVLNMMNEHDDFSLSSLISGYADCGRMNDARRIFNGRTTRCAVLWNSMISGYVSNNEEIEALCLYNKMRRDGVDEDSSTLAGVLSGCCSLGYIEQIQQMHAHICKVGVIDDIVIASSMVDAYSKCGRADYACELFSELKSHDTILLNTMITVYSSCERIEDAKRVFKTMPSKTLISWNSMIVSLSQNGRPIEALDLFCEMNKLDLRMEEFSLATVVSACGSISFIEFGEQVFGKATVVGLESDQIVSSSLIDFYCKCGFVEYGRRVFDTMVKSDEISWNSMLMGYATNGHGHEALCVFQEMRNASVSPSEVTFTGVLSACNHRGLVEEGRKWFDAMKLEYHIDPVIEHYSCMVDLFSRSGCLDEAVKLIEDMPFQVDASILSSVMRGCVLHGDKTLGKMVGEKIIELENENSCAYVQLSSIFASTGEWERSELVRKVMRDKKVKKNPGYSWAGR